MNKTILRASLLSAVLLLGVNEAVASDQILKYEASLVAKRLGNIGVASLNDIAPAYSAATGQLIGAAKSKALLPFVNAALQAEKKAIDNGTGSVLDATSLTVTNHTDLEDGFSALAAPAKKTTPTPSSKPKDEKFATVEVENYTTELLSFQGDAKLAFFDIEASDAVNFAVKKNADLRAKTAEVFKVGELSKLALPALNRAILTVQLSNFFEADKLADAVAALYGSATSAKPLDSAALDAVIGAELKKVLVGYNNDVAALKNGAGTADYPTTNAAVFTKAVLAESDFLKYFNQSTIEALSNLFNIKKP